MKQEYDFSRGTRGRIAAPEPEQRGKTRITIRLDEDVVDHFLKEADAAGGTTGYQTLINEALKYATNPDSAPLTVESLRRVLREEFARQFASRA